MFYYLIKPGTKQFEATEKHWKCDEIWLSKQNEIKKFLGIANIDNNLAMEPDAIYLDEVPESLKKEFTINKPHKSRANSKLTKDWVKFCKDHGLCRYSQTSWLFESGLIMKGVKELTFYKGDYLINSKEKLDMDFLDPVLESRYLEIRLEQAKERETA